MRRALPCSRTQYFYCGDMTRSLGNDVPEPFAQGLMSLRTAARQIPLTLKEIPGPSRAAAFAVALSGSLPDPVDPDNEIADGNFVVLYDLDDDGGPGRFKVIVMVRAELDAEMSIDPMLPDVAWTWLEESLDRCTQYASELGGAVTRTITTNHGRSRAHEGSVELELRASWTASTSDLGEHLHAWAQTLHNCAGQPLLLDGITTLHRHN